MNREQLLRLPKVELHCHLDGSIPKRVVESALGRDVSLSELQVSMKCRDLNEYLSKFDLPLSIANNRKIMEEAAYESLKDLRKENIRYVELRYAPHFIETEDFSAEESLLGVLDGIHRAEIESLDSSQPIHANVILCAMRHLPLETNRKTLDLTGKYLGRGVVCMDLAGAEAVFPTRDFAPLFEEANNRGIPFTIHAGETQDPSSVEAALDFHTARIGHGIAMAGHENLMKRCLENHIGIEMCPLSNLQTKAIDEDQIYPLGEFLRYGLLVTVNTDNRTVSGTSLTDDLILAQKLCELSDQELIQLECNAVETSFMDVSLKEEILRELHEFTSI